MNINAIPDIRVESTGDEVTYDLPRRDLGWLRFAGLLPIGFSALWCGGVGTIILQQFHALATHPQLPEYCICAFLLCFLIPGLLPAGFGLLVLFGRCRVRWRNGRLTISERVGPFGWPRRMPRQPIRKFVVRGGAPVPGERPLPGLAVLASLSANFDNNVSRLVIAGYPRPWLEAIAQDLSARAGLAQSSKPPPVEIYQGQAKELAADVPQKPASSKVVLQRRDASVVIEVPAAGLWQGSMGMLPFAIIWCLVIGLVTVAFLVGGKADLKAIPIFVIFWLIGLSFLTMAINLGKRRVTFTASPSQLTVVRAGPLGTKRFDFKRPDITNLSAGPSTVEVNHRRVPELQVHLLTGKKTGFLIGRDPDELRWIATELRGGLGITDMVPAPASVYDGWPYAAGGSPKPASPLARLVGVAIFITIVFIFGAHFFSVFFSPIHATHTTSQMASQTTPPPLPSRYLSNKPILTEPMLVFNAFGPDNGFQPANSWGVARETHADWFVPTLTGNLAEIQIAMAPDPGNPHPGKATIFVTVDKNGYPGKTLESFSASARQSSKLLTLESIKHPALQAGVKYWLCARGKGGWSWHFNDQNIVHNSAREVARNEWASAGDFCYIGAFSIRISTNLPPADVAPPAVEDSDSITNN